MPSDGDASTSGESKAEENFYLSKGKKNKKRKSSDVPSSSRSHKSSKKHRFSDVDLNWDKTFKDAIVRDIEVADLKNRIQVENPFAIDKWRSALVEPRKSTPSTENHEIVLYEVDLQLSKQLSSFLKTDYCSTNFDSGSTRNAPKMPNESSMLKMCMDEVYSIAEVIILW